MTDREAILALLRNASPALRVGDGTGSGLTPGYVVLYADRGQPGDDPRLLGDDDRWVTFQLTSVGTSPEQAEWIAAKAEGAVLGRAPDVAGRVCGGIGFYLSQPLTRDDSAPDGPFFVSISQYRYPSTPA